MSPVFVIGVPRSGTTWLGKIFDSHPAVVYRHEPDEVVAQPGFPKICPVEEIPRHAEAMRRYVAQLTTVRGVKASGVRPIFAKPFRSAPTTLVRRALAIALRAAECIPFAAEPAKRIPIPDFISGDLAGLTYVIKSVSLLGAVALLATAMPESRIIAVYRHPCGHIASAKRGAGGELRGTIFGPRIVTTPRARDLGMTKERYQALSVLDRWVWTWALVHAKLFAEAVNLPNVRIVRYECLCAAPADVARNLLAFAGLSWTEENARFIQATTRRRHRERYFSVYRDPMEAATKWQRELSAAEIAAIAEIVEQALPAMFFA